MKYHFLYLKYAFHQSFFSIPLGLSYNRNLKHLCSRGFCFYLERFFLGGSLLLWNTSFMIPMMYECQFTISIQQLVGDLDILIAQYSYMPPITVSYETMIYSHFTKVLFDCTINSDYSKNSNSFPRTKKHYFIQKCYIEGNGTSKSYMVSYIPKKCLKLLIEKTPILDRLKFALAN